MSQPGHELDAPAALDELDGLEPPEAEEELDLNDGCDWEYSP